MRWLALALVVAACAALQPRPPRPQRFGDGPFRVAHRDYCVVNGASPLAAAGASPSPRRLRTRVWFPRDDAGAHPLVVYSHGYGSTRRGGTYLAEALARRGYVVAAPDHPLTRRRPFGGLRADDVVNQPSDVRAVIDAVLAWTEDERPFRGTVDPRRIGVMGLSLGGMTATLAAFHPELRDPRIAAAVSLAGPMTVFGARFFARTNVAFLMVAGDADVIVDYDENAPLVLDRVPGGALVTIAGASHVGFDEVARLVPPFFGNPDCLGCWWLGCHLDLSRSGALLAALGAPEHGLLVPEATPRPCRRDPPPHALDPAQQQLVARVAVVAFFESRFAPDPDARRAAADYLERALASDFPEATYRRSDCAQLVGAAAVRPRTARPQVSARTRATSASYEPLVVLEERRAAL